MQKRILLGIADSSIRTAYVHVGHVVGYVPIVALDSNDLVRKATEGGYHACVIDGAFPDKNKINPELCLQIYAVTQERLPKVRFMALAENLRVVDELKQRDKTMPVENKSNFSLINFLGPQNAGTKSTNHP